jgi:hypothetical protein
MAGAYRYPMLSEHVAYINVCKLCFWNGSYFCRKLADLYVKDAFGTVLIFAGSGLTCT